MLRSFRAGRNTLLFSRTLQRSTPYLTCGRRYSDAGNVSMTKIEKIIFDNIKSTGPIDFGRYMNLCLSHPTHGYYMDPSNPVFGPRGDFITSPEISQVFGELVAIWLLSQWMNAGSPSQFRLVELGPGRGTLTEDIIRVVSRLAPSALKGVHLVETSDAMRSSQSERLRPKAQQGGWYTVWHESLEDMELEPNIYTMVVAHEFFDAMPIHVLKKTAEGWRELLLSATSDLAKPLQPVLSPSPTQLSMVLPALSSRFKDYPEGATVEVAPTSYLTAQQIGNVLRGTKGPNNEGVGGCALIVDYGGDKAFGNSFRAFKDHKIVDVFHRPGECDLTANVDFRLLIEGVTTKPSVTTHGPISQVRFLEGMGLAVRVDALKRAAKSEERKDAIEKAAGRLVDLTGMGSEYKVLGVTCPSVATRDLSDPSKSNVWPF